MINLEILLSHLEDALKDVDKTKADQLSEDERVRIAEMMVNLQMQLDMLDETAHIHFESRLNALMTAVADANIEWKLENL